MATAILWNKHRGVTTRSQAVATGVTSWDTFVALLAERLEGDIVRIPSNVSWREVKEIAPGVFSQ